ncbi:insulinase family protein [Nonomuraea sp. NPDC050310]|uniref:M16 family metallopeptidase n=1 Tax=Nonomuraea sp. NPDC050310 TaxID=3154935 RepID=UPI0033D205CC
MRELIRACLPNGLRLVLAPDPAATTVGVSVHYGVGFRTEPPGRAGFAHLFEHLMFEGSRHVPPGAHGRVIQASGGSFNGTTGPDATNFYASVPGGALERVLFLEADRMRAPLLDEAALTKQREVVRDEIRRNVLSRPYARFPGTLLARTLYTSFACTHDGYGELGDLEAAGVADCREFFERHYHPANAVLAICGDFEPDVELIERHFGDIAGREPLPGRIDEQPRGGELRQVDQHATAPALAVGYPLPDPAADLDGYLAHVLLSALLTDGLSSRLRRSLTEAGLGEVTVRSGCGPAGGILRARHPDTFSVAAYHQGSAERVLALIEDELSVPDLSASELEGAAVRAGAAWSRAHARPVERARALSRLELLFDAPHLLGELPERLHRITAEQVTQAGRRLGGQPRALVLVTPAETRPGTGDGGRRAPLAPVPAEPETVHQRTAAASGAEPAGLPPLGGHRPARVPESASATLPNGLRVLAVRCPGLPLAAVRLCVPIASGEAADASILGAMVLRESRCPRAAELERAGWTVLPLADTRRLVLSGDGPARTLRQALEVVASALIQDDGYAADDIAAIRGLVTRQLAALAAHPATTARGAVRRLVGLAPEVSGPVDQVSAESLAGLHRSRLRPGGATLVVAGELDPQDTLALAADALAGWRGSAEPVAAAAPPYRKKAWRGLHRDGAAQVQLLFGTVAEPTPAVELASAVFGGHSSSRLATTMRDRLRLTYSARTALEPSGLVLSSFDVRREAARTAIEEFARLLEGVTTEPFTAQEIERARAYLVGRWLESVGDAAGLATALLERAPEELVRHGDALATVTHEEVRAAAARLFDPGFITGVAVGDLSMIKSYEMVR